jgi:hypothetical protein
VPAVLGADTDSLDRAARGARSAADQVAAIDARLRGSARRRPGAWSGPDHEQVVARVLALSRRLRLAAADLAGVSVTLRRHAEEQRRAAAPAPTLTVERADPTGDGRLVQRVGPVDAATIVVVVPGVGTDAGDADRLLADAGRVHWALDDAAGDPADDVAVVAWLGYDPPDTVLGAATARPAVAGARTLAADVRRWTHDGTRTIVVVGHSYGALVAGRAAAHTTDLDALVQLGAPGAGPAGPEAWRHLRRDGLRWLAARAPGDPILLAQPWAVPVHGPDPVLVTDRLPTSKRGHGAYLRDPLLLGALDRVVDDLARSAAVPSGPAGVAGGPSAG